MPQADTTADSETPFQKGDDDPKVQAFRLRLVERDVREIKRMVGELHAKQAEIAPCPSPGLCIKLDERIEALEERQAEQKGAWKAIVVIATCISTLLTLVGVKVFWK